MRHLRFALACGLAALLAAAACAAEDPEASEAAEAERLLAQQAEFDYSTIPKISAHEHFVAGGDLRLYLDLMDQLGIQKALFVPTGRAPDNSGSRENMRALLDWQRQNPDRIWAFAACDDLADDAPAVLERAAADGAHGFKSLAGLPGFYRERLDGPHLRAMWSQCERLHWPVLIHIEGASDPHQQVEIERLLADFPKVAVVLPHYGKMFAHLNWCAQLLDRYPNCFMDLSMGTPIASYLDLIDEDPEPVRDLIIKYQDRLMWGADVIVGTTWTPERLRDRICTDLNLLSRERFATRWSNRLRPLRGLHLPPGVLRKIWWTNPQRIYGISVRPAAQAAAPGVAWASLHCVQGRLCPWSRARRPCHAGTVCAPGLGLL